MKKRYTFLFLFVLLCASCQKKEAIVITKENVQEVLTQYGKENPEKEVLIQTDFGNIKIRLYEETPLHRANFVKLLKEEYYEKPEFYRVVHQFVIQGGVPLKKLTYTIPSEFNPKFYHKRGALAMARYDENNPEMKSSPTEFYIIHGGRYADWQVDEDAKEFGLTLTPEQRKTYTTIGGDMSLDGKYTVFGEVVEGFDVVDKIANVSVYNIEKPIKKIPFEISLVE